MWAILLQHWQVVTLTLNMRCVKRSLGTRKSERLLTSIQTQISSLDLNWKTQKALNYQVNCSSAISEYKLEPSLNLGARNYT